MPHASDSHRDLKRQSGPKFLKWG